MLGSCPGVDKLRNPTIEEKICPECGNIIEIFSSEPMATCDKCGFVAYNNIQSCINWCKHARLCIGEDLYNKLKKAETAVPRP